MADEQTAIDQNERSTSPAANTSSISDPPAGLRFLAGSRWQALVSQLGQRYADCTLENFEVSTDRQQRCITHLQSYVANLRENVSGGRNVLLIGTKGTGKDHCLAALLRAATDPILCGAYCRWYSGPSLFRRVNDAMNERQSQAAIIEELTAPDVLAISDPVALRDSLTPFQQEILYSVVEARYRHRRPVWITVNAVVTKEAPRKDAAERIGDVILDRIAEDCLTLHFNWASYRETKGSQG